MAVAYWKNLENIYIFALLIRYKLCKKWRFFEREKMLGCEASLLHNSAIGIATLSLFPLSDITVFILIDNFQAISDM